MSYEVKSRIWITYVSNIDNLKKWTLSDAHVDIYFNE